MSWQDDPLVGEEPQRRQAPKHPTTPADAPFESVEQRKRAAESQLAILNKELQGASPEDAQTISGEIRRLQAQVPGVQPAMLEELPDSPQPWAQDEEMSPAPAAVAPKASWQEDPIQATFWEALTSVPGSIVGTVKAAAGGLLRQEGETIEQNLEVQEEARRRGLIEPSKATDFVNRALGQTKERSEALTTKGEEVGREGLEDLEAASPGEMDFWERAAHNAAVSVGTQLPGLIAGVITRNPVIPLALAREQARGMEYTESREAGVEAERARTGAEVVGLGEVITEFLPTKYLTDEIGGNVLRTMMKVLAADIPGEVLQTSIQSANAKLSRNPDMSWKEYGQDVLDTIASTVVSAPLLAGSAKATQSAVNVLRKQRGEPEIPERQEPVLPEEPGQQAVEGQINAPLTDPSIDAGTEVLDSAQLAALKDAANAIDPDSLGDEELDEARKIVEEFEAQKHAKPISQAELHWPQLSTAPTDVTDVGELGATVRQAENAEGYVNPNTGDRLDRPITFATDSAAIGTTPRQILPKPGVYVLGEPTPDRPAALLEPLMQTMEGWRQQYMPDATLVLSNEQLFSDSALGWHYGMGPGKHLIVPAVLRKMKDASKFNVNTQAGVFFNAAHEFSHALFLERLMEGIAPEIQGRIMNESRAGVVSEEALLQVVDPAARAVIQEYNELKARIMDGSMKAQEFVDRWIGPAKRGRNYLKELGVDPGDTAVAVQRAVVRRATTASRIGDQMTKKDMREKLAADFFSLEEYFAEQGARRAYARKQDLQTPLGKFLERGLASLRKFFTGLKAEGIVAPGVKFDEWMDGLSQVTRLADEKLQLAKAKQNAGKKKAQVASVSAKVAVAKPKKAVAKPRKKVEKVAHNVKTDQTERTREQHARSLITNLVRTGIISREDSYYSQMMDYVKRQEWDELTDVYQDLVGKTVKFEVNDTRSADKGDPEWNDKRFLSPKFKSWFGDWENEPQESSVVRVGVFSDANDGTLVVDKEKSSPPLVSFTSLSRLKSGQNVFYASTVRGTHFTESMLQPVGSDPTVVPVVLNIRNPWIVASPEWAAGKTREELQREGYDGIVYRNDLDGDTSFVVFSQEQIKIIPNRNPYERSSGLSLELDLDQSRPEGDNASRFYRGIKNFLKEPGPMRRSLRKILSMGARNLLQIQQLAHLNPGMQDLAFFSAKSMEYIRDRSSLIAPSDRIVDTWNDLPQKDLDAVNKILIEEMEGGVHWFEMQKYQVEIPGQQVPETRYKYVMSQRAKDEMKKRGTDADTEHGAEVAALVLDAKNDVMNLINEAYSRMVEILGRRFGGNQGLFLSKIRQLAKSFAEIRSTPFFPQARFGPRVVTIKEKSAKGPGMTVVFQQHFEDETQWAEAYKRIKAAARPDQEVTHDELTDHEFVMTNLPAELMEMITSELNLNENQAERLEQIMRPMKADKILSQFDKNKLKIKGYSQDSLRAYASWTSHFSNQISKMKYRNQLNIALNGMDKLITEAKGGETAQLQQLKHLRRMMGESRDYMMSPPTEYQALRAGVSIAYLWANVKTAGLNFFGLMTNYFNLSRKYGDLKATDMFIDGVYNAMAVTKLSSLNDIRQNNALPPLLMKAMDKATQEGVTTQSYAYHLAGVANAHIGQRVKALKPGSRAWQKVVDLGMLPFRFTEIASRRIAFMVAMQEQLKNKNISFDEQYENAVKEVAITQNDYTLANRVKIMRGGKGMRDMLPLATIFMSFAQHMSFHALGGYEIGQRRDIANQIKRGELPKTAAPGKLSWTYGYTARLWLMFMMMAGYEGLPLAENMIDLLSSAWRKMGGKKPLRQELRELVQGLNLDPMMMSRGLMHNVMGFDIGRSVGLGRVVPGTESFSSGQEVDFEKGLGGLMIDVLGVLGGVLKSGAAIYEKGWEQGLQRLPGGMGNLYTAYYWSQYGVRGPDDAQITLEIGPDGKKRVRDLTDIEIAGKALGFNPTIVSQNREILYGQYDVKMFWQSKKRGLLEKWDEANWKDDADLRREARDAIKEFNLSLAGDKEFRKIRITGADLSERERRRRRAQRDTEHGKVRDKRTRGAQETFSRSFESPSGEPSDSWVSPRRE